jgi:ABC-2 type transport system permease protein
MTATIAPITVVPPRQATPFVKAVKTEWVKLRTLRSTWLTVGAATTASVVLGAALVESQVSNWSSMTRQQRLDFDPTSASMIGVLFGAVILGSLAVRAVTSEYSTGMIRTTFTALPDRRGVLAAKAAAAAALAFPVIVVCDLVSFLIGQQILAAKHVQASLGTPGALRAIVVGAVAVSLVSVMGVGLGALIRRTAGATTVLSLVFIGGALFANSVPVGLRQYLPETAVQAVVTVHRSSGLLTPAAGLAVIAAYAALFLGLATVRISGKDA